MKHIIIYMAGLFVVLLNSCIPSAKVTSSNAGNSGVTHNNTQAVSPQISGINMNVPVYNYQTSNSNSRTSVNAAATAANQSQKISTLDVNQTNAISQKVTQPKVYTAADTTKSLLMTGLKYLYGTNNEIDLTKARLYLMEASKRESPEAMNALGNMYLNGHGVKKNWKAAAALFSIATRIGNPEAMCNLGLMYLTGKGVPHDVWKAYQLYKQAADSNCVLGCACAGYSLYKGLGVQQSYPQAIEYFQRGASKGDGNCLFMLGNCYMKGYGVEQDTKKANDYFKQAAAKGQMEAFEMTAQHVADSVAAHSEKTHSSIAEIKKRGILTDRMSVSDNTSAADSLQGTWSGKLYTYDWSRTNVESIDKISMKLQAIEGNLSGKLYLKGKLIFSFSAEPTEKYWKVTEQHASDSISRFYDLRLLTCKLTQRKDSTWLTGNIVCNTKKSNEPLMPNFFIMDKEKTAAQDTTFVINRVYPNPFSNNIKVDFTVRSKDIITFRIHDASGLCFYTYPAKEYQQGSYSIMFTPTMPTGCYNLVATGRRFTLNKKIIKQ